MVINRVKSRGTVVWYDPRKGYGYAARKDEPEVFLHYGAIRAEAGHVLKAGQEIEFLLEVTDRGTRAREITLA
jgi:cold shock CspA family protein